MADLKNLPGPQEFLFGAPLYEQFKLSGDLSNARALLYTPSKMDGHCPYCAKISTFSCGGPISVNGWANFERDKLFHDRLSITCARNEDRKITFFIRAAEGTIQKVGQFPSFADIALDESKPYRQMLSGEDASELHKAIGLAAHGVGIGAFVYIRRIFERLIWKRFDEFKDQEGWKSEEFQNLRMVDKIEFLKGHLPAFLVSNKKIYSILSLGIHELTEQDCLAFFEVLRTTTTIILDEDKRKKEELALKAKLEKAITSYQPKSNAKP